ncbi:glycosyltransferase [Nocardia gipuzkoensis]|uniref:glycosyltransferase n=1 Tax=Nocardia gipuzkoensis TaxID=2749991 RepID=UPI00237E4E9B|nr:glycosyltransferase family 2 protein [Nocardia gipuzkoensis]MDE1674701.1 glycosyltransferase family 2 protein [Nocardia gipuzkoensis]
MSTPNAALGVVIVTYNNATDLPQCLDALQSNATGARVVVRDCGSSDQSVEIAERHPAVTRVIAGANVGFGAACNEAVNSLEPAAQMVLFLNPDTAIDCNMADLLEYVTQFGEFGCVGIQQQSFSGDIVWSWDEFPTVPLEWRKARKMRLLQRSPAGYTDDRRVDWNMGAFLLIPRPAFELVGGFDEQFFLFYEEIDLQQRLARIDRPTYYVNKFHYQHDRSDKATLWREVLRLNSRRAYDRKWLTRFETLQCQIAQSYRWIQDAIRPQRDRDRRLVIPRLLATWGLIRAVVPPEAIQGGIDSWRSVRPFWAQAEISRKQ